MKSDSRHLIAPLAAGPSAQCDPTSRAVVDIAPSGLERLLPPLPPGYAVMMTPDPNGTPAYWFDDRDMREYAIAAMKLLLEHGQ